MSTAAAPEQPGLLPVDRAERIDAIDITRGIALFGVLMRNLLIDFRIPLLKESLGLHTAPGSLNHAVDWFFEVCVAGKAFTTFSLLFGVGVAVQAERVERRGGNSIKFLAKRFLVLLGIGLFHMFAIWNGDILTLYAVAGLLSLLLLRRKPRTILIAALILGVLLSLPLLGDRRPDRSAEIARQIEASMRAYGHGTFTEIAVFRAREAIFPMLLIYLTLLPRTLGVFLAGIFVYRQGIFQRPSEHRSLLRVTAAIGLPVGLAAAIVTTLVRIGELPRQRWANPVASLSMVPFALGYVALLLLLLDIRWIRRLLAWFSPVGRMALTNYLMQSVVLGLVFYNYGLGLFGKIGPAAAAPIGFALFAAQMIISALWLRRYRFGPVEWLWRSLTYGAPQPMRLR